MLQKANKVIHIEGSQATLHGSFFNNHWLAVRLTIAQLITHLWSLHIDASLICLEPST